MKTLCLALGASAEPASQACGRASRRSSAGEGKASGASANDCRPTGMGALGILHDQPATGKKLHVLTAINHRTICQPACFPRVRKNNAGRVGASDRQSGFRIVFVCNLAQEKQQRDPFCGVQSLHRLLADDMPLRVHLLENGFSLRQQGDYHLAPINLIPR